MANISTLTVSLVADTAKFSNGLKKAKRQGNAFGMAMRRAMQGAALGVGAVTTALTVLTKQSFGIIDQQQKMADRLGLTQRALAGLSLAAEQTGNTTKNFQLGLQRATRRIAEAAQGTGTAVKALKELGVEAKALAALSPDEAFIRLAGAFQEVDLQADRVRLAFKLFDSEGVGLVNTLRLGEEGVRDFIKRVEELGVALTRDQTRAIEDSNDAINVLKLSFRGLGNQIAVRVAPAIETAAEAITGIVERVTRAIPKFFAWSASIFGVKRALDQLSLADLNAEIALLQDQVGNLVTQRDAVERIFTAQERAGGAAVGVRAEYERLEAQIAELTKRYNEAGAARDKLLAEGEETDAHSLLVNEVEQAVNTATEAVKRFRSDTAGLVSEEIERQRAQWEEWKNTAVAAIESTRTPSERLQETMFQLRREYLENPFFDADLVRRLAQDAVDEYTASLKSMEDEADQSFSQIQQFQLRAFENMQDILSDFLFDPFKDGLDGMLRGFVDMLRKMVAQLVAQKLLTSFFGAFGLSFPGDGSTPARAIGGTVDRRTTLVGERGPELFTPGASGSIRPLGALNFAPVTNIGAGGDGINAATLVPLLEENNRKLKAELLDMFDRGAFA